MMLRREFGFPSGKIGIFVGDFTEVKGWPKVQKLVERRKDIFWILVSKDNRSYQADNCRTYNTIEQSLLAQLLSCADFFIVGSPVETECLAAVEACMCDIPVVMRNTGVFADFSEEERAQVGVFGDDFNQAVDSIFTHVFSPRKVMLEKGLSTEGMICRWVKVLEHAQLVVASRNAKIRGRSRSQTSSPDTLPLVSMITPAYNRASYLDETIQSVLKQDYSNIEYIVLDDGSTDNTKEVLEKYTGRLIWETHPNMGETKTVNKGWSMAHGEILAVVNSDDPLLPGAVSTAVAFLQSHPDILVAYPDWSFIDADSKVTRHVQVPEYDYLYMLRRHHCIVGPGAFIRRRAFELTGMRDPEFRYVADFEYWLRLGLYGKFARIPKTLAAFRVHADSASVSAKGGAMANEHIRLLKKFYSRPDLPPEVRGLRAEAFAWGHWVAGVTAGSSRWLALRHCIRAIAYHPKSFFANIYTWSSALSIILPKPLFKALLSVWRLVRPILVGCRRLLRRLAM
jgi:glycosyltransferase involved in cell wall biosynthesis